MYNLIVTSLSGDRNTSFRKIWVWKNQQAWCPKQRKLSAYKTQLLFQQNGLVFIKSTKYYNLHFMSLYS
jgi:hypothetical protein